MILSPCGNNYSYTIMENKVKNIFEGKKLEDKESIFIIAEMARHRIE